MWILTWSCTISASFTRSWGWNSGWWGWWSWGWSSWGGWYSSKSHPNSNLKLSISDSPIKWKWIDLNISTKDSYTGKISFTKLQYRSSADNERVDLPLTSSTYVSDYSDTLRLWYYKITSKDAGDKTIKDFITFKKTGNFRIYAKDEEWLSDYVQFFVKNSEKQSENQVHEAANKNNNDDNDQEDEVYISRSCKKYIIHYDEDLDVYTSPNLNVDEYFMNKDYFKRYVDSKNKQVAWCPTNIWRIATSYLDKSNSDRYTAPNGKVYFLEDWNWYYTSSQLNSVNITKKFNTFTSLKYYIRDRNPLIWM